MWDAPESPVHRRRDRRSRHPYRTSESASARSTRCSVLDEPSPPNSNFEAGFISSATMYIARSGLSHNDPVGRSPSAEQVHLAKATPGIVSQGGGGLTPRRSSCVSAWVTTSARADAAAKLFVHDAEGPNASQTFNQLHAHVQVAAPESPVSHRRDGRSRRPGAT